MQNEFISNFNNRDVVNINDLSSYVSDILSNSYNLLPQQNNNISKPIGLDILRDETEAFSGSFDIKSNLMPFSQYKTNSIFSVNTKNDFQELIPNYTDLFKVPIDNSREMANKSPFNDIMKRTSNLIQRFFNKVDCSFQEHSVLLQNNIKVRQLFDTQSNLFDSLNQPNLSSLVDQNYFIPNYTSLNHSQYSEQNNNQKFITTQEIISKLNSDCVVNILSDNKNIKGLFQNSIYRFYSDNNGLTINIDIKLSKQCITTYEQSVIAKNYKEKQGKGGHGKRAAERSFFLSKFSELKNLHQEIKDEVIIEDIWKSFQDKDLQNLSCVRGLTTLKEWYKNFIKPKLV